MGAIRARRAPLAEGAGRVGRDPRALAAITLVAMVLGLGLFGPALAPHSPIDQNLANRLVPPGWPEGDMHPFGTDQLGRDMLSRLLAGARPTLLVATVAVAGALFIGATLGLLAGYVGGAVDEVISWLADVELSIPYMLLAIVIVLVLGPGVLNTIVILIVQGWMIHARLVRGEVLSLREREFALAARAIGASEWRVMTRHVFPHVVSPMVIVGTLELASMIIFESGLSFLGLGVPPPLSSWGGMLADGRDYMTEAWWLVVLPGLAISLAVVGVNELGDVLRDVLDPRATLPARE